MDISVVVPLYNVEKYLDVCIHALLGQDYPQDRYEIIMVDNNSTDATVSVVLGFPRIQLLYEPKQGAYAARNRGIRAAQGGILAFTDPDCQPHPDWLSCLGRAMQPPWRGILLGRREYPPISCSLAMLAEYESTKAEYVFGGNQKEIYFGYANNMAVHRSMFDALGGFLEIDRGADTVFVRAAVEQFGCDSVLFAPEACVRHLEVTRVRDFYKKHAIYGKSTERNRALGSARPLTYSQRLEVLRRTVRKKGHSLHRSAQLFLLLSLGLCCYESGRWRAFVSRMAGPRASSLTRAVGHSSVGRKRLHR
jgi:glycosyltransferase involved in cell wall biosynthesis